MNITINKIELASELANNRVVDEMTKESDIYSLHSNGDTFYTDEAQDLFNQWYDYYLSVIESIAE
jgi:hypothetical protein